MVFLFRMSEPSNKDDPKIISSNKDDTNIDESTRMIVNEIVHEIVHEIVENETEIVNENIKPNSNSENDLKNTGDSHFSSWGDQVEFEELKSQMKYVLNQVNSRRQTDEKFLDKFNQLIAMNQEMVAKSKEIMSNQTKITNEIDIVKKDVAMIKK